MMKTKNNQKKMKQFVLGAWAVVIVFALWFFNQGKIVNDSTLLPPADALPASGLTGDQTDGSALQDTGTLDQGTNNASQLQGGDGVNAGSGTDLY